MATKKTPAKNADKTSVPKKAPAKRVHPLAKAPAKKSSTAKKPATKTPTAKAPAKKAATAKKPTPAKDAVKAPAKKPAAKATPAAKAPAKKTTPVKGAVKAPAKKPAAKATPKAKAPVKGAVKAPAKKPATTKAATAKTTAPKAPAKKPTPAKGTVKAPAKKPATTKAAAPKKPASKAKATAAKPAAPTEKPAGKKESALQPKYALVRPSGSKQAKSTVKIAPSKQRFSDATLEAFRKRLIADREAILDQLNAARSNALRQTDEENQEEDGSNSFNRAADLNRADDQHRRLRAIDDALLAIKNKTYGVCSMCGKLIPRDRLEAAPFAIRCVECKANWERTIAKERNQNL